MSEKSTTVLLTGASGFIGSHVAKCLLEHGHHVRALARESKIEMMKSYFQQYGTSFEVVKMNDLSNDILPGSVFSRIYGVIHVASPLPGRESPEEMFKVAIEGSLNILRQAHQAGVKNFVVTSSLGAAWRSDIRVTNGKHWNPVTRDEALATTDGMLAYTATKKYSELAVWEYADSHPDIDVTTILPPYVYGPYLFDQTKGNRPDYDALSTDLAIYNLLTRSGSVSIHPRCIDVRDLAQLHVKSLFNTPMMSQSHHRRLVCASPEAIDFSKVLASIREKWPELEPRLSQTPFPDYSTFSIDFDYERIERETGFKKSDFRPVEETILDTVRSLLILEDSWQSRGYDISSIPPLWQW